jgi:hypothetical protein
VAHAERGIGDGRTDEPQRDRKGELLLGGLVRQTVHVLWTTPSARDWKDTPGMAIVAKDGRVRLDQLPR